ncbi:ATP-binding protein [Flavisphingomonas formosensis]|uniref:ATP-binding protein n=1 Tax=Flavisphingomonas formosensis TaxID=861534 RepID=UPI0012FAA604|nr:ATP-binding protein [Sphingomonas formosensis]
MTGRLFWKILLGFWLTFFCMIEGLWLLFVLERGSPSPDKWIAERVSASIFALLAEDVARGGPAAFAAARARLPAVDRDPIALVPAGRAAAAPPGSGLLARDVRGPDSRAWRITYRYAETDHGGPLHIPPPILIAGGTAGFFFSLILAWYLARPIKLLRNGFDRLAQGDLAVRLQGEVGRRRDEIADLARDFDAMAIRLQQLVTARDRLLHDVSHELRSPLARLQLAIGLARQDESRLERSLGRIEQEAIRLEAMVRELLVLARVESGADPGEDYFDPIAVIEELAGDAAFEAQACGIAFAATLPALPEDARPSLRGSAALFRRAIENIVRNALRFAPPASQVTLAAALDAAGGTYRITVSDQGPGVATADLGTLFDPFVRGDPSGIGLGLAIARRAVVAHGGTIEAGNLAEGGFRVVVMVPAAR